MPVARAPTLKRLALAEIFGAKYCVVTPSCEAAWTKRAICEGPSSTRTAWGLFAVAACAYWAKSVAVGGTGTETYLTPAAWSGPAKLWSHDGLIEARSRETQATDFQPLLRR